MVTSGKLEPGFAGAEIVLRYAPPSGTGQPFERTVTTRSDGSWADSVIPSDDGAGGIRPARGAGEWTIEPRYDGDAGHNPSRSPACSVTVVDTS
jgi:hypothetical protein